MLIECITKNINKGFSKRGSHHERGGEPSEGRALLGLLSTASHKPRPPVKTKPAAARQVPSAGSLIFSSQTL